MVEEDDRRLNTRLEYLSLNTSLLSFGRCCTGGVEGGVG